MLASTGGRVFALLCFVGGALGCGDGGGASPDPGQETGPCVDNACFPGLSCLSDLCVNEQGSASTVASQGTGGGPTGPTGDDPVTTGPGSGEPGTGEPATTGPMTTMTTDPATSGPTMATSDTGDSATPGTTAADTTTGVDTGDDTTTTIDPMNQCTSGACQGCAADKCAQWVQFCEDDEGCAKYKQCAEANCCVGTECIFGPCKAVYNMYPASFNLSSNWANCILLECEAACFG